MFTFSLAEAFITLFIGMGPVSILGLIREEVWKKKSNDLLHGAQQW